MTQYHTNKHTSDTGSPLTLNALSRTMQIAVEEISPPDADMYLHIRRGGHQHPECLRLEKKTYTIGRQADVDISVMAASVSRQHARLFFLHGEEILEDLNSTNGVLVNGVRVSRCVLQDNDVIRIGDATLLFSRKATSTDEAPDA